jgi:hypothetical protein
VERSYSEWASVWPGDSASEVAIAVEATETVEIEPERSPTGK